MQKTDRPVSHLALIPSSHTVPQNIQTDSNGTRRLYLLPVPNQYLPRERGPLKVQSGVKDTRDLPLISRWNSRGDLFAITSKWLATKHRQQCKKCLLSPPKPNCSRHLKPRPSTTTFRSYTSTRAIAIGCDHRTRRGVHRTTHLLTENVGFMSQFLIVELETLHLR